MGRSRKRGLAAAVVATLVLQLVGIAPHRAAATQLQSFLFIRSAQVAQSSLGGIRATGTGTLSVSGVSGPVRSAYLFWQGRTNSVSPTVNATVSVNGKDVVGDNIGVSSDNGWSFLNSQAYRADVTSIVKAALSEGSASFALANFRKAPDSISADTNGVSLVVFYDDPSKAAHDYYLWNGNDSNVAFGSDPQGWDASLTGIAYTGGAATLTLHVGDGQDFTDGPVAFNGTAVGSLNGANFQGDTLPYVTRDNGSSPGSLWDVHSYDVASFITDGQLHIQYDTVTVSQDYLSLVVALLEVPAQRAAGVAQCSTVKEFPAKNPGTVTTTILPNATLTFTPATQGVALTTAADKAGGFAVSGLTPSTTYSVQYSGTDSTPALGLRQVSCETSFATNEFGGAFVPPPPSLPNFGNHTWLHPLPLSPNIEQNTVDDDLFAPYQKTWYKLQVSPQSRVTVRLDQLTRNYTLTAYTDLSVLAAKIKARATTLQGVAAVHSQGDISAGDLDSGDLDSGDLDSGDLDSGDLDSGDLDSGDLDSGDLDSGDLDSGDLDSGDLDSGDLDSGDLDSADVYGTAQRLGRRALSAHDGLAPESITLNTRGYSGFVYFRVSGHSGAYDTGNTFHLTVDPIVPTDASCVGAPLTPRHVTGLTPPTGKTTLILTNTARLGTSLAAQPNPPTALVGTDRSNFLAPLGTLASRPEVNGTVVNLDDPPYAALAPGFAEWDAHSLCALEANLVAGGIHDIIDAYRAANPGLKYIVFAGGHQAIPFFSQVDRAEISREWRFSPPLDGTTAGEAALAGGYYLTDDYYATSAPIERFGHLQFVPEVISSRLVESAADITAYIGSYIARGGAIATTTGGPTPTNLPSFSAGYTFNSDLASAIATELTAAGQTVDTSLNNDTWTAAQLRAKLLPASAPTHYSIIGLQAHFSANRLVPADNGERLLSTEFGLPAARGSFDGSLVESIGCHLGFNIVDSYGIPTITRPRSFPEVFLTRGATLLGNTGFGYADDVLLKSSEDLVLKFTHELRFSQDVHGVAYPGGTPLGDALLNAKLQYLAGPNLRGIDEKVVGEATLYGLPMTAITLPSRIARPVATTLFTTVRGSGLSTATFDQSLNLVRNGAAGAPSFFSVDGDLANTSAVALRPISPAKSVDVTAKETDAAGADTLARGWVLLEGDAASVPNFIPRLSLPATEDVTPATAPYINHAYTPVRPGALSLLTRPTFQFLPFQYLSNAAGTSGTARTYSREKTELYFSTATGAAALAEAPLVYKVTLTDVSTTTPTLTHKAHVDVTAGYGANAGIADLWLTYTTDGGNTWRSTLTTLGTPAVNASSALTCGTACGFVVHGTADIDTGALSASALQLFVQAVGNNALVTSATNTGLLYSLANQNAADAPARTPTQVTILTAPATGEYLTHINVSAKLADSASNPLGNKTLVFKLGRSRASATTDATGTATASVLVNIEPPGGAQPVTVAFAGDTLFAPSGASSANLSVTPAATTLLPVPGVLAGQSGPVATLVLPNHGSAPLVDQAVILDAGGGRVAATYTNSFGQARLDLGDFSGPLPPGILTISYPGDPGGRYAPSVPVTVQIFPDGTKAVAAAGSVASPTGQKTTFAFALKYLSAPSVTPGTGGALGAGAYRVGYSLVSTFGIETAIGATAPVTVGPNGAINVAQITGIPTDKVSVKFYFTVAPAGQKTGFVITRPVSNGTMAAFTMTSGPAVSAPAVSAPTGGLALKIQNASTGATVANFAAAGTPGGFDWLVITGSPASHAEFEGTGSYFVGSTSTRRHFHVTVDKPANTFAITIDATGALPAVVISGTITPLPLDDDPSSSGIVFR